MPFSVIHIRDDFLDDWSRMRQAVYSDLDNEFNEREMTLFMSDNTKECFLAQDESGRAVGMIEVSLRNVVDGCLSSPVGYVEGIFVERTKRRSGIARLLVEKAEAWCRARNCSEMATDAEIQNLEAQGFHIHIGFQETYRTVGFRKPLA